MSEQSALRSTLLELLGDEFGDYPHFLEQRFPHILQRVVGLWGRPEIDVYLNGLLGPLRPGVSGFPREALIEIARMKSYCRNRSVAADRTAAGRPAVREAFLAWLNYDQHAYPYFLEAEFPRLLEEMLPLLDKPTLGEHIDRLLTPAKQMHHSFSEAALIELMTIKAVQHVRLAAGRKQVSGGDDDHHAALVLDRHHRR